MSILAANPTRVGITHQGQCQLECQSRTGNSVEGTSSFAFTLRHTSLDKDIAQLKSLALEKITNLGYFRRFCWIWNWKC